MVQSMGILLLLLISGCYFADAVSYRCNFENGICPFLMNDRRNDENWKTANGLSKTGRSGPRIDHTIGNEFGNYLFVDYSLTGGKQVKLQTKVLSDEKQRCVRFFYHITGEDTGDLEVYSQNVDGTDTERFTRHFYRQEAQGFRWIEAAFEVTADEAVVRTNVIRYTTLKDYRIIFAINRSSPRNSSGHIALDDIDITPGQCPNNMNNTVKLCSFDYNDCGFTTKNHPTSRWKWQAGDNPLSKSSAKPFGDRTLGTDKGGYWFVESNTSALATSDFLESAVFNASSNSTGCLQFYYYMGADKKPTQLRSKEGNGTVQLFVSLVSSKNEWTHVFYEGRDISLESDLNDRQWTFVEKEVNLTSKFVINILVLSAMKIPAVTAIDDVQLIPGSCRKEDPCSPNPCLNNGRCEISAKNTTITCVCPYGYKGKFCEIVPEISRPCKNCGKVMNIEKAFIFERIDKDTMDELVKDSEC